MENTDKDFIKRVKEGLSELAADITGYKAATDKSDIKQPTNVDAQPSETEKLNSVITDLQNRLTNMEAKLSESAEEIKTGKESQVQMNSIIEKMSALITKIGETPTGDPIQKTATADSTKKYNAKEDGLKTFAAFRDSK